MPSDAPKGRARELLIRYFEQMKEAGEDEIYLSPDVARALREAAGAGGSRPAPAKRAAAPPTRGDRGGDGRRAPGGRSTAVSYTHLTLPTN